MPPSDITAYISFSRLVHEAFQFLIMKMKKKNGSLMTENWEAAGGKASMIKVAILKIQ